MRKINSSKTVYLFGLTALTLLSSSNELMAKPGEYGLKDISSLTTQNYIMAVVFAVVFLLIAALVSNAIKFEGGSNPKDPGKRKMWFWLLGILAPVALLVYNFIMIIPNLQRGPAEAKFGAHPYFGLGVCFVVYIIIGLILSKVFKHGKLGHWF